MAPREGQPRAMEGDGAQGRNRTTDTAIFSRMLYQLSYLGAVDRGVIAKAPLGVQRYPSGGSSTSTAGTT